MMSFFVTAIYLIKNGNRYIYLGLGGVWGSRLLSQTAIEREINSQLTQVRNAKLSFFIF
jgi:hypothetical protein